MRWPFAKSQGESAIEVHPNSTDPETEFHTSPGLKAALAHLKGDRPYTILDLGPAIAENVEFFSSFLCQLRIVDLLGRLVDEPESAQRLDSSPDDFFNDLLPVDQQPFDLVLAWTVFDHLDLEAARRLASRLAHLTNPGAPVFAIISVSQKSNPPGYTFSIQERDRLEYRPAVQPQRRSGPFNPAAFSQLLDGFSIDYSVVLRHGYQEYVAVRCEEVSDPSR